MKYGLLDGKLQHKLLRKMGFHTVTYGCAQTNVQAASTAPMGQPPHTTEILVIDDPDELDRLRTATVEDYRQMISAMKDPLTRLLTKWQIGAELFHVIEGHDLPLAEIANEAFVKDGTDHYLYHAPALLLFHANRWGLSRVPGVGGVSQHHRR